MYIGGTAYLQAKDLVLHISKGLRVAGMAPSLGLVDIGEGLSVAGMAPSLSLVGAVECISMPPYDMGYGSR